MSAALRSALKACADVRQTWAVVFDRVTKAAAKARFVLEHVNQCIRYRQQRNDDLIDRPCDHLTVGAGLVEKRDEIFNCVASFDIIDGIAEVPERASSIAASRISVFACLLV
jgi:hypothetical protein